LHFCLQKPGQRSSRQRAGIKQPPLGVSLRANDKTKLDVAVIIGCVLKGITRSLSLTGWALIGLSVVLYAALEFSSRWEQAKTPGEKNMGVAVLFMVFGIPMLISGAAGLLCLIVAALRFAYGRFFPRISN